MQQQDIKILAVGGVEEDEEDGGGAEDVGTDKMDTIIEELEKLNAQMARQGSIGRVFLVGVVYGVGFVVGSAILATILLGTLGPVVGSHSAWVRNAFQAGQELKR